MKQKTKRPSHDYVLMSPTCSVHTEIDRTPKGKQEKHLPRRHPSPTTKKKSIPSPSQFLNPGNSNPSCLSPNQTPSAMTSEKQQLSHYLSVLIEKSTQDPKLQERVIAIFNATIAFKFSKLVRTTPSGNSNPSNNNNAEVMKSREAFYQEHGGKDVLHKARLVTGRYLYIARAIDPTLLVYMLKGAFALKYTKYHNHPQTNLIEISSGKKCS